MKVSIIAHPNSKRPARNASQRDAGGSRVERDLLGDLHVYVNEPPLEGRANRKIIKVLAKYFKVSKSCVVFVAGTKSKSKTFEIIKD